MLHLVGMRILMFQLSGFYSRVWALGSRLRLRGDGLSWTSRVWIFEFQGLRLVYVAFVKVSFGRALL